MSASDEDSGSASLRVASLRSDAGGDTVIRVGAGTMRALGLDRGDVVTLAGPDGTVAARIWPDGSTDDETVRVDHWMRHALGVGVGDTVTASPSSARDAGEVHIALPDSVHLDGALGLSFRDALVDRVVTSGQVVSVALGFDSVIESPDRTVPIEVVETDPSAPVVVREGTRLTVSEEPAERIDDASRSGDPQVRATYEDIGDLEAELKRIRETVELPLRGPELFRRLGVDPPTGVLLHGPSGTGKTLLSNAVANELDATVVRIRGPEIVSKYRGESEERLRDAFEEATDGAPSLVIVDELDAIAAVRNDGGHADGRLVGQLISLLDDQRAGDPVTVIGTTNRADAIDPALRRPGRFGREIEIGVPDRDGRKAILEVHTRDVRLGDDVDLGTYADNTHGFVGADLESLVTEASMNAIQRVWPDLSAGPDPESPDVEPADRGAPETAASLTVTDADFRAALTEIEPSALREVRVEVPDVTWQDVGGLEEVKERLRETVQWPLEHPEAFERVALDADQGILLHGPPGTGKTLLAKAVANESRSNFISVKGPELLNKYVGESEKGVREVFSKARQNAPSVVFFDEIDAITAERGGSSGPNVGERVVSQFLTELDGLEEIDDVVVVATTNRKDLIDDALLRAGRIERHLHVPVPGEAARREVFAVHTRDRPLADDVDLDALVARTEGYVGADIEAICREAAAAAVREYVRGDRAAVDDLLITADHFERALDEIEPSEGESGRLRSERGGERPGNGDAY